MKRIATILVLSLGLSLCMAAPSGAAATDAQRQAVKQLPENFSNLLESTFYCQGVAGEKPYVEAKALALSVLGKLTDAATAERFVAGREKTFEAGCPQAMRSTCWADFLEVPLDDPETGKDECHFEQKIATEVVVLTLQTIRGTPVPKN